MSVTPGSIGKDWRCIEEFYCCLCQLAYPGDEAWVCEHGEAFDCCSGCGMLRMGLECEGLPHADEWKST